jgi:hypothetical protein
MYQASRAHLHVFIAPRELEIMHGVPQSLLRGASELRTEALSAGVLEATGLCMHATCAGQDDGFNNLVISACVLAM